MGILFSVNTAMSLDVLSCLSVGVSENFSLSYENIHKKMRRGESDVSQKGDIVLPLQLLHPCSLNHLENNSDLEIEERLKELSAFVSEVKITKGIIRIKLDRNAFLSNAKQILTNLDRKPKILFPPVFHVHCCNTGGVQFISTYREELIADHLSCLLSHMGLLSNIGDSKKCFCESSISLGSDERKLKCICIHVTSDSTSTNKNKLICSPVTDMKTSTKLKSVETSFVIKLIKEELHKASEHKFGSSVNGISWEKYLVDLCHNCTKIQLLSVAHNSPLKMDLTNDSSNSRDSAFILYNYARVCMIFKNFETLVSTNYLPPLPLAEEVDFTLLKLDEEWELFWTFIDSWFYFVKDIGEEITKNFSLNDIEEKLSDTSIKINYLQLPLHKVYKFLHRLAHRLSTYYKHCHILPSTPTEKVPKHLLPKLWARLYLLKGILTVMDTGFSLLKINPPDMM